MDIIFMQQHAPQIIATAVTIVLLPLSKYVARKLVRKYGMVAGKSETRIRRVRQIMAILLNMAFLIILALIWGVKPQNMFIALSSVFAVLGVAMFAQWSILSNVTAGIVMFFSAPYRIGDSIRLIDKDVPISATIDNIGTFYTYIRNDEGELIVLPNNLFLQKIVSLRKDHYDEI